MGAPRRVLFAAPWWHEDLMRGMAWHAAERGWHLNLETALSGRLPERWAGDGVLTTLGGDPVALKRFLVHARCPAVSLSLNCPEFERSTPSARPAASATASTSTASFAVMSA